MYMVVIAIDYMYKTVVLFYLCGNYAIQVFPMLYVDAWYSISCHYDNVIN